MVTAIRVHPSRASDFSSAAHGLASAPRGTRIVACRRSSRRRRLRQLLTAPKASEAPQTAPRESGVPPTAPSASVAPLPSRPWFWLVGGARELIAQCLQTITAHEQRSAVACLPRNRRGGHENRFKREVQTPCKPSGAAQARTRAGRPPAAQARLIGHRSRLSDPHRADKQSTTAHDEHAFEH